METFPDISVSGQPPTKPVPSDLTRLDEHVNKIASIIEKNNG